MTSIFGTDPSYIRPSGRNMPNLCNIRPDSILGKIIQNPECKPFVDYIQCQPDLMKRLNHPQTSGTFFIPYRVPPNLSKYEILQLIDRHTCPVIYEPKFFYQNQALIHAKDSSFTIHVENNILNHRSSIQSYHLVGKDKLSTCRTSASAIIYYIDEPLY